MECQMLIVFAGGTCGDIVCQLIDKGPMPVFEDKFRSKLKHPYQFNSDKEKLLYIEEANKIYKTIPSHDVDFHIQHRHDFVGITVKDHQDRIWASQRFKALNQPESWDKMTKMIGENSIESYARAIDQITQRIQITKQPTIDLKDIREGRLIMQLNAMNIELISSAEKDYQQWLEWH